MKRGAAGTGRTFRQAFEPPFLLTLFLSIPLACFSRRLKGGLNVKFVAAVFLFALFPVLVSPLTLSASAVDSCTLKLTLDAWPPGAWVGYDLSNDPSFGSTSGGQIPAGSLVHQFGTPYSIYAETKYYVRLKTCTADSGLGFPYCNTGASSYSNAASITTPPLVFAPLPADDAFINEKKAVNASLFLHERCALSVKWDFGDGSVSDSKYASHQYSAPGSYALKLTANGGGGKSSTTSSTLVVKDCSLGLVPSSLLSQKPSTTAGVAGFSDRLAVVHSKSPDLSVSGLQVVDVSNPDVNGLPVLAVVGLPAGEVVGSIVVEGSRAYVLHDGSKFRVYDLSDPRHPVLLKDWASPLFQVTVFKAGAGGRLFLAGYPSVGGSSVFSVVDFSSAEFPVVLGSVSLPASASDLALKGDLAFVALGSSGVVAVDFRNPAVMTVKTVIPNAPDRSSASSVLVDGNYLFVAGIPPFWAYDVTDPFNLKLLNSAGGGMQGNPVALPSFGRLFFLRRSSDESLEMFDARNPRVISSFANKEWIDYGLLANAKSVYASVDRLFYVDARQGVVSRKINAFSCLYGTDISKFCSDGTPWGSCSADKPTYCVNGGLTAKCSVCGCPSGLTCSPSGTCSGSSAKQPPKKLPLPAAVTVVAPVAVAVQGREGNWIAGAFVANGTAQPLLLLLSFLVAVSLILLSVMRTLEARRKLTQKHAAKPEKKRRLRRK